MHYKWMGFLQQFHLFIKYKKGSTNKLVDILSQPPTSNIASLGTLMHMDPFTHDVYKEAYIQDEEFMEVFWHLDKICVPKYERFHLISEAHTSKVVGNFGVVKTISNL
jgi:hypothetical protein